MSATIFPFPGRPRRPPPVTDNERAIDFLMGRFVVWVMLDRIQPPAVIKAAQARVEAGESPQAVVRSLGGKWD